MSLGTASGLGQRRVWTASGLVVCASELSSDDVLSSRLRGTAFSLVFPSALLRGTVWGVCSSTTTISPSLVSTGSFFGMRKWPSSSKFSSSPDSSPNFWALEKKDR